MGEKFSAFVKAVEALLNSKATQKGYAEHGDCQNPLDEFMRHLFPHHALGEIVYKVVRYKAQQQPEDLLKVAAWAFLLYARHEQTVPRHQASAIMRLVHHQ